MQNRTKNPLRKGKFAVVLMACEKFPRKIDAVRLVYDNTLNGLKESKDIIDSVQYHNKQITAVDNITKGAAMRIVAEFIELGFQARIYKNKGKYNK